MSFRTAFRKLVPWWLSEGEGGLVLYTLGVLKEWAADRATLGNLYGFPEHCPDDALVVHGRERRMRRGINESSVTYARRLLTWRQAHKVRGSAFGMLRQIRQHLGVPIRVRTVDQSGNWYTIEADGSETYQWALGNWNWDGTPGTEWAKFWVVIYSTGPQAPWRKARALGSGHTLGEPGATIGTTATPSQVDAIRVVIEENKPAHAHLVEAIIAFDDALFDPSSPEPDGTWGQYSANIGGAQTATRHDDARYWRWK